MPDIIKEVLKLIPQGKITDACFEGANIVLYTKDTDFFMDNGGVIKKAVEEIKKRIELRPDPSITLEQEKAEAVIRKIIPAEAEIDKIIFDPQRSRVIIEAEKPGIAIGKEGGFLRDIRRTTMWVPLVRRKPAIRSKLIEDVRAVLYQESDYRRKFLDATGHRIYDGWRREKRTEWVRITYLGGGRQVGRSCLYVQTPESRVLLDCGVNVASTDEPYPMLEAPEFNIQDLDAVILSHSHLDHCLTPDTLVQLSNGDIKQIHEIENGQPVVALDFKYSMKIEEIPAIQRGSIQAPNPIYELRTSTKRIKATGNHPVFVLDKDGTFKIKHVEKLQMGDCIATPRIIDIKGTEQKIPIFAKIEKLNKEVAQFLGYVVGDGYNRENSTVILTDKDVENLKFYSTMLEEFGIKNSISIKERNRLNIYSTQFKKWLENIEPTIFHKSPIRKIPRIICKSEKEIVAAFLRGLYDAEGSVKDHSVVLCTSSEDIAIVSQMLLLRFGIISHLYDQDESKSTFGGKDGFQLCISNPESLNTFTNVVGFSDKKKLAKVLVMVEKIGRGIPRTDLIPITQKAILDIAYDLNLRKVDIRRMGFNYHHYTKHAPSRKKVIEVCEKLLRIAKQKNILSEKLTTLLKLAKSDIYWDPVISSKIIQMQSKEVYDLTVPGHSNYIANGIFVHNCGFIPYLYKYGYRGPVYCTAPSRDIMALLLLDYVKIMHSEGKEPIFTTDDVKEVVKHTICIGWEEVTDITPDIRITLYNAGHIIGSSQVHLNIGNGAHNIVYTGDMKFGKTMLLEPANTHFPRMETLCIESTYGGKENVVPDRRDTDEELKAIIEATVKRGGKILMPTLGVGRAQEILILIEHMVKIGMINPVPVYIDGMVWDITAIHTAYPEFFNATVRKRIFHKDENPFLSPIFKRVGSHKERMQVIEETGSCVVLATSGMLVGGPSVEYLKHFGDNPQNTLIFTCYQGEGSLGRKIQSGEREVVFPGANTGEVLHIQMEIYSLQFTGHSGRNELMNYVSRCNPKPRKILVNHGESSRCLDLASGLHKMFHIETLCPKNLESVRLR